MGAAVKRRQTSCKLWRTARPLGPITDIEIMTLGGKMICQILLIFTQNMNAKMLCLCKNIMALGPQRGRPKHQGRFQ